MKIAQHNEAQYQLQATSLPSAVPILGVSKKGLCTLVKAIILYGDKRIIRWLFHKADSHRITETQPAFYK